MRSVLRRDTKSRIVAFAASSRVGRKMNKPGLVVTCLNAAKPRDRSHYERFGTYHESFYRFVEATSVTPFSAPALDRGLTALVVGLVRHGVSELAAPDAVMDLSLRPEEVSRIGARVRHRRQVCLEFRG